MSETKLRGGLHAVLRLFRRRVPAPAKPIAVAPPAPRRRAQCPPSLESLHRLLNEEGLEAFRRALASLPQETTIPLPPRAAVTVARILETLPPRPGAAEAAADLVAWLATGEQGATRERHLLQILRAVDTLGAAPALKERLEALGEGKAVPLLLLGLLRIAQGEQLAGGLLVERALDRVLPASLRPLAKNELAAARFQRLGATPQVEGPTLAVIEPSARAELLQLALEEAPPLLVCGTHLLVMQNEPGLRDALAAGRLRSIPYRMFQGRATYAAARIFSERLLRLATGRLPELHFLRDADPETREGFRSTLQLHLRSQMAFVYNALEALRSSGARRVLLIANSGWFAAPLAVHLVGEGAREVGIACAAHSGSQRRRLGAAFRAEDPLFLLDRLADPSPPHQEGREEVVEAEQPLVGPPLIDLNLPAEEATGTRRCLICVAVRMNTGMTLPMPLRDIPQRLPPDWEPLILVLANGRKDPELILDSLRGELGDLLPRVPVKLFSFLSAFGSAAMPRLEETVGRLLTEAEVADVAVEGLALSRLLRNRVWRYFGELRQVATMAPALDALLRDWAPEVLLTPQHPALEWRFLQASARRRGIPMIGLQLYALNADLWRPSLDVDHFLCFDDYSRDTVEATADFPPERVSIIGSARWDGLIARARAFDRATERRALGLGAEEKLVLLATQPLDMEENHALIGLTIEALTAVPQARLAVKLHPAEKDERLAAFAQQVAASPLAARSLVTREHDTYSLLAAADLVVNVFSNVGIEAAILDLDVVAVEIGIDTDMFSLGTLGIVEPARSHAEAIAQIRGLLLDPEHRAEARRLRDAYFQRNPQLRDGRSTDRLVEILVRAADAGRAGTWAGRYAPLRAAAEELS